MYAFPASLSAAWEITGNQCEVIMAGNQDSLGDTGSLTAAALPLRAWRHTPNCQLCKSCKHVGCTTATCSETLVWNPWCRDLTWNPRCGDPVRRPRPQTLVWGPCAEAPSGDPGVETLCGGPSGDSTWNWLLGIS